MHQDSQITAPGSVSDPGYSPAQRITIIVSCMLGFGLDMYDVLIMPFLMPAIQKSLHMTLTEVASMTSLTLIGSVMGGALFGWAGDRWGRKASLQLSLLVFALGSILSAASWNYPTLAVLRFITGIGLGGEWGAGMVLFNEAWNPQRRGLGSAFIQGSAVLASSGAAIVGTWAVSHFAPDTGWRIGLLTGGSPILIMLVVRYGMPESRAWREFDARRRAGTLPATERKSPLAAMFRPDIRWISIGTLVWMMAYMFAYYGVIVFMPTLMLKVLGTPPDVVRSTALIVSVIGGLTYLSMGWLNDRLGRRIGALLPSLMWVVALVGLYFYGHVRYAGSLQAWPLFWLYIAFGMGNTSLGVVGTWLSELFPIEMRSTAVSTVYMAGRAVSSVAPLAVPAAAKALGGDLPIGMLICLPSALLFLLITMLLPETRRRAGTARDMAAVSPAPILE